jgi:C-terminal processing protease CtpA/Prc
MLFLLSYLAPWRPKVESKAHCALIPCGPIIFSFSLLPGATSEQSDTVQPGDEILQLAGNTVQGLTRFEAWNVIKALPDGPVIVVIKRKSLQSKGTTAAGDS